MTVSALTPFTTTRLLVGEFKQAEALLRGAIHEEFSGNFFTPSPVVVIHPMEMVDGGLSEVEERLFRELAAGAGARNVFVHVGPALSGDTAIALRRPLTEDLNGRELADDAADLGGHGR